jgi:cbb3-type cytochrome oxidase subunit 3
MQLDKLDAAVAEFKKFCRNYFRNVMEITIRAILLLIGTAVLNLIVLYFYNVLWHIYRMTYSGKRFIVNHPKFTQLATSLLSNDIIETAVETTFSAFTICILVCAICQVFHITRYLFNPQNSIIKLLFWGLPLTAAVSMYINDLHEFEHWAYTFPITIVPTLCVFTYCFEFTENLLPEIGSVLLKILFYIKALFTIAPQRGR